MGCCLMVRLIDFMCWVIFDPIMLIDSIVKSAARMADVEIHQKLATPKEVRMQG